MKNKRGEWRKTGRKSCTKCQEAKSVSDFLWLKPRGNKRAGPGSYCYPCHADLKRKWDKHHPKTDAEKAYLKGYHLKRKYGLSVADYRRMLAAQNNVCAICGREETAPNRRLAVDHCHGTKKPRGLLCTQCNTAIGKLQDSLPRLQKAMEYLRSHGATWL